MRQSYILIFFLALTAGAEAQTNNPKDEVSLNLSIQLDSIERRITINKNDTDTNYYLHYTVKNISLDTLTYVTNSCFYYNHCTLSVEQTTFDLNADGACIANALTFHSIAPGESYKYTEWITASNLKNLTKGESIITLIIPVVKDNETTYRIDGRDFVKTKQLLIFTGSAKMTETKFVKTKRKKKST